MHNGFLRLASVCPEVFPGNVEANLKAIIDKVKELDEKGVEVAVFPELCLTGYTCADLFHNKVLLDASLAALEDLAILSESVGLHFTVGLPVAAPRGLYNCAAFLRGGNVSFIAKSYLPTYNEFYEARWWQPAPSAPCSVMFRGKEVRIGSREVFASHGANIGVEICEDLWVPVPPSCEMALKGADVILNLSASDDLIGKYSYLTSLIRQQSARCLCAYAYAGAGWGESSTDLVFDGKAIIAENGSILAKNRRWTPEDNTVVCDVDIEALRRDRMHFNTFNASAAHLPHEASSLSPVPETVGNPNADYDTLLRHVDPLPFVPSASGQLEERCEEIINIQVAGLAKRLAAIGCTTVTIGISGGLDSTLALLVCARAFDRLKIPRSGIVGVTMPGFGTTGRTHGNALELMKGLGVTIREISIVPAVEQHFKDIGHDPEVHDVTYENSQARMRTLLLMDIANQTGGIVVGTGDLSELALGWATYNGDHMSMYGVNAGVPKTLVRHLVRFFASLLAGTDPAAQAVLLDIVDTPISPELLPATADGKIAQITEDVVGPYELHDFFLYYTLRYGFTPERILLLARHAFEGVYDLETIEKWLKVFLRRFFAQQFKRSCLPDGPKVGSVCLSPRGDWRMPSDISSRQWLESLEQG